MTFQNAHKIIRQLRRIPKEVRGEVNKVLALSVAKLDADAKQSIQQGSRTGVERSKGGRSSAPGEYPKTDTGALVGSLFFNVDKTRQVATFGSDIIYGKYLEFGTSKMAARPWLRPTYRRNSKMIKNQMKRAMRLGVRKGVL